MSQGLTILSAGCLNVGKNLEGSLSANVGLEDVDARVEGCAGEAMYICSY